jgi:ABC-type Fe3+-hydroxamate transport system substrate-binding protein
VHVTIAQPRAELSVLRVVTDQMGRELRLPRTPQRIVSLVPSQTELLFDIGAGDRVVGVTDFCTEPPDMPAHVQRIGGTKRFLLDRIEALAPDLIIGNHEENYREGIEALAARFPVWMSDILGLDDALAMIRAVGELVDARPQADALADAITGGFSALDTAHRIPVAYLIWRKPWMAAGARTFIHAMLQQGGFDNVFADCERYPECTLGEIHERAPRAVLLSSEPFPFGEAQQREVEAAIPGVRVLHVDAMPFSWYGSRLLQTPVSLRALREQLAESPV